MHSKINLYCVTSGVKYLFVRYLLWADYLQTVQVKSIQTGRPPRARLGAVPPSRCMVVAVFKIHPLELMACVSVDRKVDLLLLWCDNGMSKAVP